MPGRTLEKIHINGTLTAKQDCVWNLTSKSTTQKLTSDS